MTDSVSSARQGTVAGLTLNQPEALNAFDRAMCAAFDARLAETAADDAVRAIVIAAAGERAFSAGVDLKALNRDLAAGGSTEGYGPLALTRAMVTAKPVIAAVHGHCVGEGVALALAERIVGETAPLSVLAMKETLFTAAGEGAARARETGEAWRERLLGSEDFAEGRKGFAERRPPRFRGR